MLFFYMKDIFQEQYENLIAPVNFFLHLSRDAYGRYMNNKIFLHAKCIRYANEKVCHLLEEHSALIPDNLLNDAIQLLNHYRIWMLQFSENEIQLKPGLADMFIFHHLDNQSAFPKSSELKFFDYYNELKHKVTNG